MEGLEIWTAELPQHGSTWSSEGQDTQLPFSMHLLECIQYPGGHDEGLECVLSKGRQRKAPHTEPSHWPIHEMAVAVQSF